MHLKRILVNNFQCFGPVTTEVVLEPRTFLLGGNGTGKTALMQALCRQFGYEDRMRAVKADDFHSPLKPPIGPAEPAATELWIETHFGFDELEALTPVHPAVAPFLAHLTLLSADGVPELRVRLTAYIDEEGVIEDRLECITELDSAGNPQSFVTVPRHDRSLIQVHYVPARRDPADHIQYTTTSLLGRLLRSANWLETQASVADLTSKINDALSTHAAIDALQTSLSTKWAALHFGPFFGNTCVSFGAEDLESILKHLTIKFGPSPTTSMQEDFRRLSDGQQSLLYISLVLTIQQIGQAVLRGERTEYDAVKLHPPVFVLVAMEEPENSLSPQHVGRLLSELTELAESDNFQVLISTHSPALVRRVLPEQIRYLRLDSNGRALLAAIEMPQDDAVAAKYVREAVLAFPELYFARFVVFGEGDSEEIVIPRLLSAKGLIADHVSVAVVPLGGRHVNHFWRLLHSLGTPHATLLDLDAGRNNAGWSRLKYAITQYELLNGKLPGGLEQADIDSFEPWDSVSRPDLATSGKQVLSVLEDHHIFFSAPLDLDYAMMRAYPTAYGLDSESLKQADTTVLVSVLGGTHGPEGQYTASDQETFDKYRKLFKTGSKPVSHITALSSLTDAELVGSMPESFDHLVTSVAARLAQIPT